MMATRLKPISDIVYHHITVRTAQKKFLLESENVKLAWATKLTQLTRAYYIDVYAQTILSNHVHLVLRVRRPEKNSLDIQGRFEYLESTLVSRRRWHDEWEDDYYDRFTDLSCFMRDLNQWLASWHNKFAIEDVVTSGHLWGRRFFSKVVGDDQYLLTVMAYVDLNAVRAGIVELAGDFEYCTAGKLKLQLDRGEMPSFPAVGFLRYIPDDKRAEAYLIWLDFLAEWIKYPYGPRPSLESLAQAIDKEGVDMGDIQKQIKNKEPSNWGEPVFGNQNFAREVLRKAGWESGSVHDQKGEPTPSGQGNEEKAHV